MNTNIQSKFDHQKLIFLAPMEGITNVAYRNVATKYMQADVICTEFVRLSGQQFNPKQIKDTIRLYDNMILSVQLMGDNPKLFAETIPYFEEIGVKIIDLNLGCPSTLTNKKGCGAAMLKDLILLETIVSAIRKNCNVTFSCKMRSGWADDNQTIEIGRIIQESGADFLTLHPRTRLQAYEGHSKWDLIRDLKQNLTIPIIGNGDILSPNDAKSMIAETSCDGIMVGRGVLRDPFLLNKINDYLQNKSVSYQTAEYIKFYQDFIEEMIIYKTPAKGILNKMKEHFRYFSKLLVNGDEIWANIKSAQSIDKIEEQLNLIELG